jgi:hypothetical protein
MGKPVAKFGNEESLTEVELRQRVRRLAGEILHERAVKIEKERGISYTDAMLMAQQEDPDNARAYADLGHEAETEPPERRYTYEASKSGADYPLQDAGSVGDAIHQWIARQVPDVSKLSVQEYRVWMQKYRDAHPTSKYDKPVT